MSPQTPLAPIDDDGISEEALDHVMTQVPRGAIALASIAIGTLMLAYFLIYFFVFLPRGTVS